jgi:ATP:corrinoid adenosyltransferase
MFKEIENLVLQVSKIEMKADKTLMDDKGRTVPYPLIKSSGFLIQISGSSKSGKTTLLVNLISKRAKDGIRQSYIKLFDDIVVVSPSRHTLKKDIFEDIDDNKKFDNLGEEVIEFVYELTNKNKDEDRHTLLILDDVSILLKNPLIEKDLVNLSNNRRHRNLSIIFITQIFNHAPASLRKNLDLLMLFKPKTRQEQESLIKDYFTMKRDEVLELLDFVYRSRYDFMILDFTQRRKPEYTYFRNFNEIEIEK